MRIGLTVSPWQIAGDFLPDLPTPEEVHEWAAALGESYATLGARFDFLDNIMTYAEGGSQGEKYIGDEAFFDRLLIWVEGISAATDTRVILDNVPVGNSVYRTLDDTDFHWRDSWVEWILGDDDFDNLIALRDAGVAGIVFGVDGGATTTTCPCDAAEDGVSNTGRQRQAIHVGRRRRRLPGRTTARLHGNRRLPALTCCAGGTARRARRSPGPGRPAGLRRPGRLPRGVRRLHRGRLRVDG